MAVPETVPEKPGEPNKLGQSIGRALLCSIFLASAIAKIGQFDKETGGPMTAHMTPKLDRFLVTVHELTGFKLSIPKEKYPQIMLTSATAEFLGAALLASDIRFGAQVLAVFIIPVSLIMHPFWDLMHSPVHMQNELIHFLKNVAILGGLVYYLATAPGTRHRNKYQRMQAEIQETNARRAAAASQSAATKKDS